MLNKILPSALSKVSLTTFAILLLGVVNPGLSAYKDSLIKHNTPCFPT